MQWLLSTHMSTAMGEQCMTHAHLVQINLPLSALLVRANLPFYINNQSSLLPLDSRQLQPSTLPILQHGTPYAMLRDTTNTRDNSPTRSLWPNQLHGNLASSPVLHHTFCLTYLTP